MVFPLQGSDSLFPSSTSLIKCHLLRDVFHLPITHSLHMTTTYLSKSLPSTVRYIFVTMSLCVLPHLSLGTGVQQSREESTAPAFSWLCTPDLEDPLQEHPPVWQAAMTKYNTRYSRTAQIHQDYLRLYPSLASGSTPIHCCGGESVQSTCQGWLGVHLGAKGKPGVQESWVSRPIQLIK